MSEKKNTSRLGKLRFFANSPGSRPTYIIQKLNIDHKIALVNVIDLDLFTMRAFTLNKHFGVPSFSTSDKMSLNNSGWKFKNYAITPRSGHFHGGKRFC